jgi:hypothetical protein
MEPNLGSEIGDMICPMLFYGELMRHLMTWQPDHQRCFSSLLSTAEIFTCGIRII